MNTQPKIYRVSKQKLTQRLQKSQQHHTPCLQDIELADKLLGIDVLVCPAHWTRVARQTDETRVCFACPHLFSALHALTYFLRTHSTGNGTSLTLSQKAKFDEETTPFLIFNIVMDFSFHVLKNPNKLNV